MHSVFYTTAVEGISESGAQSQSFVYFFNSTIVPCTYWILGVVQLEVRREDYHYLLLSSYHDSGV